MPDYDPEADASHLELRFRPREPKIHPSASLKGCKLADYVEIGPRVTLRDAEIGAFTYFEPGGEATYASIGRFCSIAPKMEWPSLSFISTRTVSPGSKIGRASCRERV